MNAHEILNGINVLSNLLSIMVEIDGQPQLLITGNNRTIIESKIMKLVSLV